MKSRHYILGMDCASGKDESAVAVCQYKGETLHVLGFGTSHDTRMALAIAIHSYLKSLPWWKRLWVKSIWKITGRHPVVA